MSTSYEDDSFNDNMDELIGSLDVMEDADQFDRWNDSLSNTSVGPDLLPTHAPCLGNLRLLKTCLRSSRGGINSCIPQLRELEDCSTGFYRQLRKKVPPGACEDEIEAYFTTEIRDLSSLKNAKNRWQAIFSCAKIEEDKVLREMAARRSGL